MPSLRLCHSFIWDVLRVRLMRFECWRVLVEVFRYKYLVGQGEGSLFDSFSL